jgi:signal transduction histidine kinase/CheY-like chemotaxis protein
MMSWVAAGLAVLVAGLVVALLVRARGRTAQALGNLHSELDRSRATLAASDDEHAGMLRRQADLEKLVRDLEERLLQAQKMEIVGQMTGGIAHDFNNILTVIQVEGAMAREVVDDGGPVAAHLDELLEACGRAAALSSRLLLFSRRRTAPKQPLPLDAEIRDLETLLARLVGERHRLVLHLNAENAHVLADSTHLQQLLTSLVANARDAMPDGGRVLIRTNLRFADEGLQVRLDVQDEGRRRDVTPRAGAGLGLDTVHAIVRGLAGSLEVQSEHGVGTVVSLVLPVAVPALAEAPKPVETPPPVRERTSASGRLVWSVLLVEDQDPVREAVRRALERIGCLVVPVRSGRDALRRLERGVDRFDLLLADVIMPVMTGVELAEIVRSRHPVLRVLLMSGDVSDEALLERLGRLDVPVLRKPFTPEELLGAVSERLVPVPVST